MKTSLFLVAALVTVGVRGGGTADAAETWRPSAGVRYPQPGPVADPVDMPRLSLELFANSAFAQGKGFHLFSNDKEIGGGGLAGMFRLSSSERLAFSARLEVSSETSRGTSYEGGTKLRAGTLAGGVMMDVMAHKHVRPYVQITAGRATAQVDLFGVSTQGAGGGANLHAEDSVFFGTGAAGVRFISRPKSWWSGGSGFAVSAYFEGGYTLSPKFSFDLKEKGNVSEDDIPKESVRLGSLERTRAHVRAGVAVHF